MLDSIWPESSVNAIEKTVYKNETLSEFKKSARVHNAKICISIRQMINLS